MNKKQHSLYYLLGLLTMLFLVSLACSSSYITPASLTATANAAYIETTPLPTAFFVQPTNTPAEDLPEDTEAAPEETEGNGDAPTEEAIASSTPTADVPVDASAPPILYLAQAGDTLNALSVRFSVNPIEIVSEKAIPEEGFIEPDQLLMIPQRIANTTFSDHLMPDSEVVYSPSAADFDPEVFVESIGGYLSDYNEYLGSTGQTNGADIIQRVASENSINPRLLLSLLEYEGHWVFSEPGNLAETDYPMGHVDLDRRGLYRQLVWAVNQLSVGYYGWREGNLTELHFTDGNSIRIAPDLNAGTVAIMYYFSQLHDFEGWLGALDPEIGYPALHEAMFGDPWLRADIAEPLFPPNLEQPDLILPFLIGQLWSYTGGPHGAWEGEGSQAALDFAPGSLESGCVDSDLWAVAAAAGLVVRSNTGVIAIDLDGDGNEQTGWVLVYLHLSGDARPAVGTWLDKSDFVGHPSCEGGRSTGTHLHIARKYNGEWIAADGPIPFVLSGWRARAGDAPYLGTLERESEVITACTCGSFDTNIRREDPNAINPVEETPVVQP
ncbi:MAG: hypothetical protein DWQ07_13820 [Chloroflexi bacterium]|nr:MAG: hypothetical protein DWQ07_13820 [Chloroflexota bacterium]MBL1194912.1 hypothetical protein [Chloroflexota bacterium]NOH12203.1 hypothetical protein [Chloroflexota bacterium]